ncbi:MAG: NAD-dependent epimerase/dehydratase family protein [Deltaproteobacteria bacterium]|nr:NAD-dependent epimerase/dehydratase family protein [Deltaproteobacteria bacterium]
MARKKRGNQKTIVLTGTAGFHGSTLLRALEDDPGYPNVIAIDNRKPPFELKKTRFYRMDLTATLTDSKLVDLLKNEGVDTFIHMAFPYSPPHNLEAAHELVSVGTMYVLNCCAALGVRKIVMSSTTEVYGAHPSNPNFLSENHERRGGYKSRFLKDKIEAENQFLAYAKKHPEAIVTLLRPCTTLGPHVKNYKTTFLQRAVLMRVLGYDPLFQFVHEEDVLRAFKLVIKNDCPGVFNIVGDGVLPLSRVLQLAGKFSIPVPSPLLYPFVQLMWYSGFFAAPSSRLDFLKYLSVADGEKARQIGFNPKYSSKNSLLSFLGAQRVKNVRLLERTHP